MPTFTLYSSPGCHLCDQARLLLARLEPPPFYTEVDITKYDHLLSRYGEFIPVLQNNHSGNELNWPFDKAELEQFTK